MPKCLKCEKDMKFVQTGPGENTNENNSAPIDDGGFIEVTFHYGSRHDQCHGFEGRKHRMLTGDGPSHLKRLLASDRIQGYICDDCFEKHLDLFEGWDKYEKVEQTRRV